MSEPSRREPEELSRKRLAAGLRAVFAIPAREGPDRAAGPDPASTLVGRELGGFRVLRPIGAGGMGAVFEAEQSNPRRRVALKVVRLGLASRSARDRFEREIRLLATLQHPGIASIHEAGVAARRRPGAALLRHGAGRG